MTFRENSRLDSNRVNRRSRGATGGVAVGGGIGGLLLVILGLFFGVDLSSITGGGSVGSSDVSITDEEAQADFNNRCQTGADANEYADCRVLGTVQSLDDYWETAAPQAGIPFSYPEIVVFDDSTASACGTASQATGPFYCPGDTGIYIDTSFFDLLVTQFGSSDGALAEMYVVAHEYGHHIQNIGGVFNVADRGSTGANSDTVKVELMADCLAGAWAHHASTTEDASGTPFLEPFTEREIQDALDAAAAVGDDHIQERLQGQTDPHTYTHGTSEQRMDAFMFGYENGDPQRCDLFNLWS